MDQAEYSSSPAWSPAFDVFHPHNEIFQRRKTLNRCIEFLKDLGRLLGRLLSNEQFPTDLVVHGRSKLVHGRN